MKLFDLLITFETDLALGLFSAPLLMRSYLGSSLIFSIFGYVALSYVHIPSSLRQKLQAKAFPTSLLGYDDESKGYGCYDPAHMRVIISRDVTFFEHTRGPFSASASTPDLINQFLLAIALDFNCDLAQVPEPEGDRDQNPADYHDQVSPSGHLALQGLTTFCLQHMQNGRQLHLSPFKRQKGLDVFLCI